MAAGIGLGMRALPIAMRLVGMSSAGFGRGAGIVGQLSRGLIAGGLFALGMEGIERFLSDEGVPGDVANAAGQIIEDMDALYTAGMLYIPEAKWGSAQADVMGQLNYTVIEHHTGLTALVDNKRFWPQRFFQYRG